MCATTEYVPGTARSKLRAFSRSGETYCKSRVVNWGSCFSIFLKTCEYHLHKWIFNDSYKSDRPRNRYPKPCRASQSRHRWYMRGKPLEPHANPYRKLERRKSRGWWWVPVIEALTKVKNVGWRATYSFDHIMQRLQHGNHSLRVPLGKVQPGCLFQTFMP